MSVSLPSGGRCRVCAHPRLDMIEVELVKAGTVKRALARSLGIGRMSLQRHAQLHLPERLKRAAEAAKKAPASQETLQKLADLNTLARGVFTKGYNTENLTAAISALRELRKIVELEGRLLGQLNDGSTTNVLAVTLSPGQAAGMAEILLQRHRAKLIETTAEVEAVELPAVATRGSEDSEVIG
ncbi:MAG TPA: hypothetical protein VN965_02055 [Candidatus Dormibacteraeota bacterium]|nr:hypothetical protein [Candidatus Dormibacteraeota bacterium]